MNTLDDSLSLDIDQATQLIETAEKLLNRLQDTPEDTEFWTSKMGDFILRAVIKITDPIVKLNSKARLMQRDSGIYYLSKRKNKGYKILKKLKEGNKKVILKALVIADQLDSITENEANILAGAIRKEIDILCPERNKELTKLEDLVIATTDQILADAGMKLTNSD